MWSAKRLWLLVLFLLAFCFWARTVWADGLPTATDPAGSKLSSLSTLELLQRSKALLKTANDTVTRQAGELIASINELRSLKADLETMRAELMRRSQELSALKAESNELRTTIELLEHALESLKEYLMKLEAGYQALQEEAQGLERSRDFWKWVGITAAVLAAAGWGSFALK